MSLINKPKNRGDTLIEVLFATTVFSLVAVGAMSIMNQGTATSLRALEITLARQEIDSQAETLRFLNASYISSYRSGATSYSGPAEQWRKTRLKTVASVSAFSAGSACAKPSRGFILNARTATLPATSTTTLLQLAQTYSRVHYDNADNVIAAEGIWIEAVSMDTSGYQNQTNAGYIDFHIRACWDSPGQSVPVTLGTIVRLYEPRG